MKRVRELIERLTMGPHEKVSQAKHDRLMERDERLMRDVRRADAVVRVVVERR